MIIHTLRTINMHEPHKQHLLIKVLLEFLSLLPQCFNGCLYGINLLPVYTIATFTHSISQHN